MIVVSETLLLRLDRVAYNRFVADVRAHIARCFPEQYAAMTREELDEIIAYGIERARAHGFTGERDVCKYIDLMCVFGRDFDGDDRLDWASTILDTRWPLDPSARIDHLGKMALRMLRTMDLDRRA